MPATVHILSYHTATQDAGTSVEGGSIRFKQADNDTVDANNPIPVPASGSNYSYVKQLQFSAATTPANQLTNLKVYSDGANGLGTGVDIVIAHFAAVTGTATSGGASTLTNSGASWTVNQWANFALKITGGTGSGQTKTVVSNTATVITISGTWTTNPDATSTYALQYIDPTAQAAAQVTSTQISGGLSDVFGFTSGSPMSVTGTLNNPTTGAFGDMIIMQMSVASTATQGTTGSENITFSYDES